MNLSKNYAGWLALLLTVLVLGSTQTFAQAISRDPLGALKRALSQASAPALTTQQETDLTALITTYKAALPDGEDPALQTAHEAYDAALIAGDLAAAQTQAQAIAARLAALNLTRLNLQAKFEIDVLANLNAGGQLTPLVTKFEADRVLALVRSLAGGGGPGLPGGAGRGLPGGGPGGGPHGR
jgi:hypothetical protein